MIILKIIGLIHQYFIEVLLFSDNIYVTDSLTGRLSPLFVDRFCECSLRVCNLKEIDGPRSEKRPGICGGFKNYFGKIPIELFKAKKD